MAIYILKRVLSAIPTLWLVSLAAFFLLSLSPLDPVEKLDNGAFMAAGNDPARRTRIYALSAQQLGLDKPLFYFSIYSAAQCDTLYLIFPPERRSVLKKLTAFTGNWPWVQDYDEALQAVFNQLNNLNNPPLQARQGLSALQTADSPELITAVLAEYSSWFDSLPGPEISSLRTRAARLSTAHPGINSYLPKIIWNGRNNQYHHWITGVLTGDFGKSYRTRQPVWPELRASLGATLALNGTAMLLAAIIAIPLGVAVARRKGKRTDWAATWILLALYALPSFGLGLLLINLLATPQHGFFLIKGIYLPPWQGSGLHLLEWMIRYGTQFILPIVTLALHMLAFFAIQMRGGMLETLQEDYIRTARAKGLREDSVYWRHAFKNALFPLVTTLAAYFPAVFGGALVVESIFNYPGMGGKVREAIGSDDIPFLVAVFLITAFLTIFSNLVADSLYARLNPRVRYS